MTINYNTTVKFLFSDKSLSPEVLSLHSIYMKYIHLSSKDWGGGRILTGREECSSNDRGRRRVHMSIMTTRGQGVHVSFMPGEWGMFF